MTERSTLMRVPMSFKQEVEEIARSRRMPTTRFLREDGVRLFKNARALSNLLFGGRK